MSLRFIIKFSTGLICTWRVWHVSGCNHAKSVIMIHLLAFPGYSCIAELTEVGYPTTSSIIENQEPLFFVILTSIQHPSDVDFFIGKLVLGNCLYFNPSQYL